MKKDDISSGTNESKRKGLFRQVLASVRRQVKSFYKPFEEGDTSLVKFKKVMMGIAGTLWLILVSPIVLFVLIITLLVAL